MSGERLVEVRNINAYETHQFDPKDDGDLFVHNVVKSSLNDRKKEEKEEDRDCHLCLYANGIVRCC